MFYRYAVKYIPSKTVRIPLKVFSGIEPDGMIRLPEQDVVEAETFPDSEDPHFDDDDDDDDIPPPVRQNVKMTENEEDFFDVSDEEEETAMSAKTW
jgi:hypothetical protein